MFDCKLKLTRIIGLCLIFLFTSTVYSQISVSEAFSALTFSYPIDIQSSPDTSGNIFIVSQDGKITLVENNLDTYSSTIFLDITNKVLFGGEQGLLGLAFHPDYKNNGYFYLNYIAGNPRRTIISRFSHSAEGNTADINSELILIEIDQPYSNHNGGQIAFGPDGFLYTSLGDGGSGGDPDNLAQNLQSFLGKILRIDVNDQENGKNYKIPDDNPLKGNSQNFREEIFAYGLRNVWRFSFDSQERLWAADVGQNKWEEINIIEIGGNYGWRIMEGLHCYNPSVNCDQEGLILPIWEYGHNSAGGYSVTGGYVYEGNEIPELSGKYIYADYVSGNIWALNPIDTVNTLILKFDGYISTFGVDNNNDLYFADYNTGIIYKLVESQPNSVKVSIPKLFELRQNYPNPFNSSTAIKYTIPKFLTEYSVDVKLTVHDILGKKISTLINRKHTPGTYEIKFEASDFSSGVYYYNLSVNGLTESRKMIYLK